MDPKFNGEVYFFMAQYIPVNHSASMGLGQLPKLSIPPVHNKTLTLILG